MTDDTPVDEKPVPVPDEQAAAKVDDAPLEIVLPKAVPVQPPGQDSPTSRKTIKLPPMRVEHLKGVGGGTLDWGVLLQVGLRAAHVVGGRDAVKDLPAKSVRQVIEWVEAGVMAYNARAEVFFRELKKKGLDSLDAGVDIDLERPVQLGSETTAKLHLAPLTVGHMWKLPTVENLSIYDTCQLGGIMAGVSELVIDHLRLPDAGRVGGAATAFLLEYHGTGSGSSET